MIDPELQKIAMIALVCFVGGIFAAMAISNDI